MSFKKISINKTGSVSNDQYLNQMQKKDLVMEAYLIAQNILKKFMDI